jgi:hypothetical protein
MHEAQATVHFDELLEQLRLGAIQGQNFTAQLLVFARTVSIRKNHILNSLEIQWQRLGVGDDTLQRGKESWERHE